MRPTLTCLALLLASHLTGGPAHAQQQDVITTFIGGGPNDVPARDADLVSPESVALDSAGNYYIADYNQYSSSRVFKVDSKGFLTVLAGTGIGGFSGDGVPGGAANAQLSSPGGVA